MVCRGKPSELLALCSGGFFLKDVLFLMESTVFELQLTAGYTAVMIAKALNPDKRKEAMRNLSEDQKKLVQTLTEHYRSIDEK